MESIFSLLFPEDLAEKGYNNQNEFMLDCFKRVELLIMYYVECMESIANNLTKELKQSDDPPEDNNPLDDNRKMVFEELKLSIEFINSRIEKTELVEFFALEYISTVYRLSDLEYFCLLLNLMAEYDSKYENMFAYLQGDKDLKSPGYDLVLKLYYFIDDINEIEDVYLIKSELERKMSDLCFEYKTTNLDKRLKSFIMYGGTKQISINGVYCYTPIENNSLPVMENIAERLCEIVNNTEQENIYFHLWGVEGLGKRTQVKRFAEILGVSAIMVDLSQIYMLEEKVFYTTLLTICREAIISQGFVCFYNFDVFTREDCPDKRYENLVLDTAQRFMNVIFILSEKEDRAKDRSDYLWIDVPIQYPNKEESIKLWEICLSKIEQSDDVKAYEMANKFTFTPGQIARTGQQANRLAIWKQDSKLSREEICSCAYSQVVSDLEEQASLIHAKYDWKDLVLPEEEKTMLMNACDQITYKHIVYNNWGFEKRLAYGRGVSMLFAGPPGTGKTMAARVVAKALGIEIYKVNLSQIMSKYIGETEKNLNVLFDEAKKSNVILFFDETDALFGKRTEVKDSHDKNANLETSYLLQKMEEYDGVTVMSTNYLENIDAAFFRRISYVIHFPFPNEKSRKEIWKGMYPKEVPLSDDVDFDYLARQFELSGGNIKNIAVTSAFLAARNDKELKMKHILTALKYELTKQGKTLLKEDFGEFSYILDK